jgi:small nuclear ribonucleoprotein (snRNP)-like protein
MAKLDRLIRSMIRTRYIVTLDSEETFEGVLIDADDQHLVLADVVTLARNGDRLAVDGQLWLPRIGVKYLQTLTV